MRHPLRAATLSVRLPDGTPLFQDLDLSLAPGVTGLVGPNGGGKSTLLSVLAGERAPSSGVVYRDGLIALLPQRPREAPHGTVADVLGVAQDLARLTRAELGLDTNEELASVRWELPARIEAALARVGLDGLAPGRPAATLSGGERTRLALARLLLVEPAVLLLDEPTNHLDEDARAFVRRFVRTCGRPVLVASHDRALLGEADEILELKAGRLRRYGGGLAFYEEASAAERESAQSALHGARERLERAREAAREVRERQERRDASARRSRRSANEPPILLNARKGAAQVSSGRLAGAHEARVAVALEDVREAREHVDPESVVRVDLSATAVAPARRLASVEDLNVELHPSTPLWPVPLSFRIVGPERIWLRGPNGSGKSTLLRLLLGRLTPSSGCVRLGATRVGFLDQHVSVLDDGETLVEAMRRLAPGRPEHERRLLLGRFLFEQEAAGKRVGDLSGGERVRAGLAALLLRDQAPELLLLDEPTNDLDLTSLRAVSSALSAFHGALIVVTHDPAFAEDIGLVRQISLPPDARLVCPNGTDRRPAATGPAAPGRSRRDSPRGGRGRRCRPSSPWPGRGS